MRLLTFIFLLLYLLFSPIALAIDSSQSTQASSSAHPDSVLQKLESLKKEIASKAALIKADVNKKMEDKIIIGVVLELSEGEKAATTKITLETKKGKKQILVDEYTDYLNKTKGPKKLTVQDIKKDDYFIALGDIDERQVLTAKKMVKDEPLNLNRKIIFGHVQQISLPKIQIIDSTNQSYELFTSSLTDFGTGDDEVAEVDGIKLNRFLVSVGREKESQIKTSFIYIIQPK